MKKKRAISNFREVIEEIQTHRLPELSFFPHLSFLKKLEMKRKFSHNSIISCPFLKEHTPSFSYSQDRGFWHCFGCGKGGKDIIDFFMEYENVHFFLAVLRLARAFKIPIKWDNKVSITECPAKYSVPLDDRSTPQPDEYSQTDKFPF